jgi:hypothetical protein
MAGELILIPESEYIVDGNQLFVFTDRIKEATVYVYSLTPELLSKLESEEIYPEDLNTEHLEYEEMSTETQTGTADFDALQSLKEQYLSSDIEPIVNYIMNKIERERDIYVRNVCMFKSRFRYIKKPRYFNTS